MSVAVWKLFGALRLVAALPVLLSGLIISPFIGMMPRDLFAAVARGWYRSLLFILGIHCRYRGVKIEGVCLIVSNHISWADILVIGARYPFVFLAMKEVSRWPVAGWLARRAGTLFITRGSGADDAVEKISASLEADRSVIFFPEGRTSRGIVVGRFHSRIFAAAVETHTPVVPVALFYADRGGEVSTGSRVTFADEAGLVGGIWRTVCGRGIDATMIVFPALESATNHHHLAAQAYALIDRQIRFTVDSSASS